MSDAFTIRRTLISDCDSLPEIERSAAAAFAADPGLAWLAKQDPVSRERHADLIQRGVCFVAADKIDAPCGFIVSENFETDLHIWEMSVSSDYQQRGIGRQLLTSLEAEARALGLQRLTLTTFRDLVWNAPFYQSCGFAILNGEAVTHRLAALLKSEADHGLPRERRCAMAKTI